MRYLIICILAIYLGYGAVSRGLIEPARELLNSTAERIVNAEIRLW
jgi:hypothetical protein